ncbi:MAG: polyphenol oxidase family protein [Chloroflexi bacterium]|nr:polyphenol oxidase family protein [Chloroflexota bacterium]
MSVGARPQVSAWRREGDLLVSPALERLGLAAGFTTRARGSLGGAAASPDAAARARSELARTLGFDDVVRVKQVHGDRVVKADAPFAVWPEADGLWTDRVGVLLGVTAADCVPILVADRAGRIGVAHAGWEGTSRSVARRLVAAMRESGAETRHMVAAIGPSIGPCCYTIGPDRVALIRGRLGPLADDPIRETPEGAVFDLWSANAAQLRAEGVAEIEVAGTCTRSSGLDLWSYRARDRMGLGLGLGFIGRRARDGGSAPVAPTK